MLKAVAVSRPQRGIARQSARSRFLPSRRRMAVAVNECGPRLTGPAFSVESCGSGFDPPRKGLHECRRLHLSERAARYDQDYTVVLGAGPARSCRYLISWEKKYYSLLSRRSIADERNRLATQKPVKKGSRQKSRTVSGHHLQVRAGLL